MVLKVRISKWNKLIANLKNKEEAGVDIKLTGILSVQHSPSYDYTRMRVIFLAEPINPDQLPKSLPDYESVGAAYASLAEINTLPLRGSEPAIWAEYYEKGGTVMPLSMLGPEK